MGVRGTTVIDDDGEPFEMYPSEALADEGDLDWGCGLFHLPGCPAERLEDPEPAQQGTPPAETPHDLLATAPQGDPRNQENWPAYEAVAPLVCAVAGHAAGHEPEPFRALVLRVLDYFNAANRSELGVTAARTLQRTWGRALGGNHRDTLSVANRLAGYLLKLGEHQQAYLLFDSTYRRRLKALGADDPDTLRSASNLALTLTLTQRGISGQVRELREDALRRRRRVLGEDHPDTLVAAVDLGMMHLLAEEFAAARDVLVVAQRRAAAVLGPDDPTTLRAAQGVAAALRGLAAES